MHSILSTERIKYLVFVMVILVSSSCTPERKKEAQEENLILYAVAKIFPHDAQAFTQGLTIDHGRLFESTGESNSWIAEVDVASGQQSKKIELDKKYFGEGITILNNKIYQLTWQNHIGFIYNLNTFGKIGEFHYDTEGWGITHDGKNLIMSDGTEKLYFLDTVNLKVISTLLVKDKNAPVDNLNELEFIEGYIFANQWQTNFIIKIDPVTGNVIGKIDFSAFANKIESLSPQADVLNGIAYEKKSKMLLITGKRWPALYAVQLQNTENLQ